MHGETDDLDSDNDSRTVKNLESRSQDDTLDLRGRTG